MQHKQSQFIWVAIGFFIVLTTVSIVMYKTREYKKDIVRQAETSTTSVIATSSQNDSSDDDFYKLPKQEKIFVDPEGRYQLTIPEGYVYNYNLKTLFLWKTIDVFYSYKKNTEDSMARGELYSPVWYDFSIDSVPYEYGNIDIYQGMPSPIKANIKTGEAIYAEQSADTGDYVSAFIPARDGGVYIFGHGKDQKAINDLAEFVKKIERNYDHNPNNVTKNGKERLILFATSKDDTLLYYKSVINNTDGGINGIYLFDSFLEKLNLILTGFTSFELSPDGQKIAYVLTDGNSFDSLRESIVIYDLNLRKVVSSTTIPKTETVTSWDGFDVPFIRWIDENHLEYDVYLKENIQVGETKLPAPDRRGMLTIPLHYRDWKIYIHENTPSMYIPLKLLLPPFEGLQKTSQVENTSVLYFKNFAINVNHKPENYSLIEWFDKQIDCNGLLKKSNAFQGVTHKGTASLVRTTEEIPNAYFDECGPIYIERYIESASKQYVFGITLQKQIPVLDSNSLNKNGYDAVDGEKKFLEDILNTLEF